MYIIILLYIYIYILYIYIYILKVFLRGRERKPARIERAFKHQCQNILQLLSREGKQDPHVHVFDVPDADNAKYI